MSNNWKTSITEIVTVFRGALLAIIPWVEKAKIKWKDGESYDDWDNIAQVLFENIVCSSIYGEVLSEYSLSSYDFQYNNYSDLDYIKVKSNRHIDKYLVFVSFQTKSTSLDMVKVAVLNDLEEVIDFLYIEVSDAKFSLVKSKGSIRENIEIIEIVE